MKTATINIKIDPALKKKAQARAKKLGVSLSSVLHARLYNFAEGQALEYPIERMTPHMERLIEEIEKENEEKGTVGPFDSVEDAIAYLKNLPPDEN